ncbi:hypothetical protein AGDE_16868 [Angomonas deanei]|nr:hypothetical protein AGDE_16868 [Angomonas deanei]|eukprot:EPY16018.1 hypothetical protein AGDE_16868 [Angomonas deanei]
MTRDWLDRHDRHQNGSDEKENNFQEKYNRAAHPYFHLSHSKVDCWTSTEHFHQLPSPKTDIPPLEGIETDKIEIRQDEMANHHHQQESLVSVKESKMTIDTAQENTLLSNHHNTTSSLDTSPIPTGTLRDPSPTDGRHHAGDEWMDHERVVVSPRKGRVATKERSHPGRSPSFVVHMIQHILNQCGVQFKSGKLKNSKLHYNDNNSYNNSLIFFCFQFFEDFYGIYTWKEKVKKFTYYLFLYKNTSTLTFIFHQYYTSNNNNSGDARDDNCVFSLQNFKRFSFMATELAKHASVLKQKSTTSLFSVSEYYFPVSSLFENMGDYGTNPNPLMAIVQQVQQMHRPAAALSPEALHIVLQHIKEWIDHPLPQEKTDETQNGETVVLPSVFLYHANEDNNNTTSSDGHLVVTHVEVHALAQALVEVMALFPHGLPPSSLTDGGQSRTRHTSTKPARKKQNELSRGKREAVPNEYQMTAESSNSYRSPSPLQCPPSNKDAYYYSYVSPNEESCRASEAHSATSSQPAQIEEGPRPSSRASTVAENTVTEEVQVHGHNSRTSEAETFNVFLKYDPISESNSNVEHSYTNHNNNFDDTDDMKHTLENLLKRRATRQAEGAATVSSPEEDSHTHPAGDRTAGGFTLYNHILSEDEMMRAFT